MTERQSNDPLHGIIWEAFSVGEQIIEMARKWLGYAGGPIFCEKVGRVIRK